MDNSELLGPVLKAWFKQWDWPQSVTEGVARAKGWENGPWASQISICMSGRLTPKPAFFEALGEFNRVVAERDFAGITDRRLLDRLRNGQPLTHDDGVPWTAIDFFACYLGQLEGPEPKKQMLTEEEVEHWQSEIRGCFRDLVLMTMETPAQAWKLVAEECKQQGISTEDVDWTQEVVCGLRDCTVEEATRLAFKYKGMPLIKALLTLQEAAGGDTARIKKLLAYRGTLRPTEFPLPSGMPVITPTKRPMGFDVPESARGMVAMRSHMDYSIRANTPQHGRQSNTGVAASAKPIPTGHHFGLQGPHGLRLQVCV
jgi:hypothetical protein